MPKTNGHGQSAATSIKQAHLRQFLHAHLRIAQAVMRKYDWADNSYSYFDITAGPGIDDYGHASPLIFLDEAAQLSLRYKAVFMEKDEDCYNRLCDQVETWPGIKKDIEVKFGDNVDLLPKYFIPYYEKKLIGLIYADPNGLPPTDLLMRTSWQWAFRSLDVLVNIPATTYKRMKTKERLVSMMSRIAKKHWLIREPVGAWQWTLVFGTQMKDFPEFAQIGFHRLNSSKGMEILKRLELTVEEAQNGEKLSLNGLGSMIVRD